MNEKQSEERQTTSPKTGPGYAETIAMALGITLAALFCYDRYLVPKVKVADLKSYVQEQKALLASGELSEEEWRKNLDTMEERLEQAPPHHLIILKDVVLRHVPDTELDLK